MPPAGTFAFSHPLENATPARLALALRVSLAVARPRRRHVAPAHAWHDRGIAISLANFIVPSLHASNRVWRVLIAMPEAIAI